MEKATPLERTVAVERPGEQRRPHPAQRQVDTSPRQQAQQERIAQLRDAPAARDATHRLPGQLRSGIEALSGMDMGNVVVHRNSSRPAQLNAHAYAQGNDIHLGPGQERHLPHEAWHVVQQRKGQVRATGTVAGTAINDNPGLEREADTMGQRALQMRAARAGSTADTGALSQGESLHAPVQMQNKHFPTLKEDDPLVGRHKAAVTQVLEQVEKKVDHARGLSLNWSSLNGNDPGYVGLWARTARQYFDNPRQVPDFIHARFGYAIETFACGDLPLQHGGLNISFQVSTGHTRPDIVLTHPIDGVVAWLDITSLDSMNHILGKDNAGWRSKPFVYEVFYQPLALPEVLTGLQDPVYKAWGDYLSLKNEVTHEREEHHRVELRNSLLGLQEEHGWTTGLDNAKGKQAATKTLLKDTLGMKLGRNSSQATRGALALSNINDGPFGFNVGDIGTDSQAAKNYLRSKAEPEIAEQHAAIENNYLEHYQDMVADHQDLPLVEVFYEYLLSGAKDAIEIGTAVAATVDEYDSLKEVWTNLSGQGNERAKTLREDIAALSKKLPQDLNFNVLRDWSVTSLRLREKARLLEATLQEQALFFDYLKNKYGAFDFARRTPIEHQIVQRLAEMPHGEAIVLNSRKYREEHPI